MSEIGSGNPNWTEYDTGEYHTQSVSNPFVYGSPIAATDAGAFADRAEELAILEGALGSGGNVILLAPRPYGKTSLLNIPARRAAPGPVRAPPVTPPPCTHLQHLSASLP